MVIHALNGICVEFQETLAGIKARETHISFEELFKNLTNYEKYLRKKESNFAHILPLHMRANSSGFLKRLSASNPITTKIVCQYYDRVDYSAKNCFKIWPKQQHQSSTFHPSPNIAERRHRQIVETWLTFLHQASLPLKYRSFAFQTAIYIVNRLFSKAISNKSPFECMLHQSPNYSKLKMFGCLCYP